MFQMTQLKPNIFGAMWSCCLKGQQKQHSAAGPAYSFESDLELFFQSAVA